MNNTASPGESASTNSGPSTIEIIIGLLALALALAAVVVAILQLHQARAARQRRQRPEPELGQNDIELPTITVPLDNTTSIDSNTR